jgi:diguanylate cyclase (GGDEF)-like protein/PAS domain S-box-containing protein
VRIATALVVAAACLGLRLLILPVDAGLAFLTFYPGTALVALLCGAAPTLVYILVAGLVASYFFVFPYWSFVVHNSIPVIAFLLAATSILLVIHFYQRRVAQEIHRLQVANEAIREREVELAEVQRIAKIGSWSWDMRTDAMRASQELCRMFGLQEIPQFAQQDGVMFPHDAWLELRDAQLEIARTGLGYDLELPALNADGSQMWVNSRAEVVLDPDGERIGLRGMVQDITEHKQSESIAHSERFVRSITDSMPGLVAYFDREVRCQFANQSYLNWYKRSRQEMLGTTLKELMGDSLYAVNESLIHAALEGEKQHFERFLTRPDGSIGHVLADYIPDTNSFGEVVGFSILVTDIKALKLAETELKMAATVYQNTAEGIMVTDSGGIILSVNPAFTQITGYPAEEAIGQTPRLLRSDRHDPSFHASVWQQITEQGRWQGEIWNRSKDGGIFLEWQTITRIAGSNEAATRYVSVFHDITDTWQINEDNRHLAFHDALTQLPNRALLTERLERQIARAEREPRLLAVMFLDLDRFKAVNDTLGHAVGDELLIAIARKLQALVRKSDTVARFGGDEFVIKLDNPANKDEVMHIADRVIAVINEPMEIHGHLVQVGASVGIAMFPEHGATAAELIKSADAAMYEAKRSSKNSYHFFASDVVACRH